MGFSTGFHGLYEMLVGLYEVTILDFRILVGFFEGAIQLTIMALCYTGLKNS